MRSTLCLNNKAFNLQDPVLRFALILSQSTPSNFSGYHLLHHLLSHALMQTPSTSHIPIYSDHPDLYDFSLAIMEWRDQENIASIPRLYTEHSLAEHFLCSLPHEFFSVCDSLLR